VGRNDLFPASGERVKSFGFAKFICEQDCLSVQMGSMFAGMSAFPLTPADAAGRVDSAGMCRLLVRLKDANYVDYVGLLLGSTGTYYMPISSEWKGYALWKLRRSVLEVVSL
jgi:hypothetical protein